MRSRNSMYNLLAAMGLQIVTLIVGIILPKVMIVTFGSEINGLVSSIKQFINYLTLVEAGLAGACIYSLYKPLTEKNYNEINKILSSTKKFYNRSGIIFSILAFGLAFTFPYISKSENIGNVTVVILTLILGINGSLEFFSMGKYRALLTASQKSYVISIIQAIGQVLNCIIIVILSINKCNIVLVQLIATASYIVRSLLFRLYIKKRYKFVDFCVSSEEVKLHQRWDVLFNQVAAMVVFNSPIALITFFCTLIEVSIYSIYNMIFSGINGIVAMFTNGLTATIGHIISESDLNKLRRIYSEYECVYYMIITWMYSCTYILIIPFVRIYTKGINDADYIRKDLVIAFVIIGILNTLRMPQVTLVNAAGHFKQTRYRALSEVIINIVASVVMVNYLGMIGVLLGGMCSYAYRTLDFIIYAPKHITKLPVKETLIRILRMIILGTIIIIPFKSIIHIQADNFIEWIMWGCIVAAWSGIVVFLGNYITERSTVQSLINRVFMVLGRKTRLG